MSDLLVLPDVSAATWDAYHRGRQVALAPDLARCWARARDLGAPPDGAPPEEELVRGAALRERAEHVELVRAVGEAILERATARVADRDFLLLLADPDGVVVRTSGGGGFADTAARLRLIEGACWSERARGTNAIGTAAVANRPTEVHGHAHFGRSYHELVCYAAPVRGLDGRPLAVLDATSHVARADPEVARTILDAARALEQLVRLDAYAAAGASVARVLGRAIDRVREPALLVEAPGVIARANAAARDLLGGELAGADAFARLGVAWPMIIAEALGGGGLPAELGRGAARRSWRLRAEPIAAPGGAIVAAMVVLEPGRVIVAGAAPEPGAIVAAPSARARRASAPGLGAPAEPFAPIFAEDDAVKAAVRWSRQLAASELPVMLLAETGAGKELFAHAIHLASPRAAGPWHAINCGALAPSLLEAELFGYAPGAFTGAERAGRAGLFHAAAGGTLFLDEVAEMSPAMQAALLRVVETQTYRRVGDVRLERTDVRIVCATCRDLGAMVAAGAFRQDLYYRLKGAAVRIPPLRERTDVRALVRHLLGAAAPPADDALDALARHAWPGNVRELKTVLAVAQVAAGGGPIALAHLPPEIAAPAPAAPASLDGVARDALVRALAEAGGNVSVAARRLGVARSTIHRMRRRHKL